MSQLVEFWMSQENLATPRDVLLYQPPVRSVTPEHDAEIGLGLSATVYAVRALVASMHRGESAGIPPYIKLRSDFVCWTPSFVAGRAPECEGSQPFNSTWLSFLLGNMKKDRAHDVVKVALGLLDMKERGEINEDDLRVIYAGGIGLRIPNLLEKFKLIADLRAQKEATSVLESCQ